MGKLGRRVRQTILENVVFSLGTKAIVMGFTFAGYSSLWAAIGSDVGAMLLVTLNGMKLLPSQRSIRAGDGFDTFVVRSGGGDYSSIPLEGGSSNENDHKVDKSSSSLSSPSM